MATSPPLFSLVPTAPDEYDRNGQGKQWPRTERAILSFFQSTAWSSKRASLLPPRNKAQPILGPCIIHLQSGLTTSWLLQRARYLALVFRYSSSLFPYSVSGPSLLSHLHIIISPSPLDTLRNPNLPPDRLPCIIASRASRKFHQSPYRVNTGPIRATLTEPSQVDFVRHSS